MSCNNITVVILKYNTIDKMYLFYIPNTINVYNKLWQCLEHYNWLVFTQY